MGIPLGNRGPDDIVESVVLDPQTTTLRGGDVVELVYSRWLDGDPADASSVQSARYREQLSTAFQAALADTFSDALEVVSVSVEDATFGALVRVRLRVLDDVVLDPDSIDVDFPRLPQEVRVASAGAALNIIGATLIAAIGAFGLATSLREIRLIRQPDVALAEAEQPDALGLGAIVGQAIVLGALAWIIGR